MARDPSRPGRAYGLHIYIVGIAFLALIALALLLLSNSAVFQILLLVALPFAIPRIVVKMRFWIFTRLNGEEGVQFPNETVKDATFQWLYSHPDVSIRSQQSGVGLSDFFWYLLEPASYIHQEHVESNTRTYDAIATATRRLLAAPKERLIQLAHDYTVPLFNKKNMPTWTIARIRDLFFPVFAHIFHELLYNEPCSPQALKLILDSGQNVIDALKCTTMRDMAKRAKLTEYVKARLESGETAKLFDDDCTLTLHEKALHIQGVFFHTGCVQMSEAISHMILAIAQHSEVQAKLQNDSDGAYMNLVVTEVLRLFPLFGIAHRMTAKDVVMPDGHVFPTASVLCFNYPEYQTSGFEAPFEFDPSRWLTLNQSKVNYIPFGVKDNRPCPAQRVSLLWMNEIGRICVQMASFSSPVDHTRSMPDRGHCLVIPKHCGQLSSLSRACIMSAMWLQDAVEGAGRSVLQLTFGTYMLADARRKKLAYNYFHQANIYQ